MINIYSNAEIEKISEGGKLLSKILHEVAARVEPGVTTAVLEAIACRAIKNAGATPAFLGYTTSGLAPYPAALCTSVNDGLVHCFPGKQILQAGDIVSLDLGIKYEGLYTDMAITVPVGQISEDARSLLDTTERSLNESLKILKPGLRLGDLGGKIQSYADEKGFGVVRDLVGHGVGRAVHEDPQVPNYGKKGTGLELAAGMVLAIEPMFTLGSGKIKFEPDGWQIKSADGSLCAHFEKTVAIIGAGYRIITP